ncbi:MAG TPA: DUF4386 domain-containing protein, partial [Rhizomicrobium sp.]|nr:DUF4386 domain-containing protein [Rhizomicrobium sp.]
SIETPPQIRIAPSRDAHIAGALYLTSLPIGLVRSVYVQFTLLAGSFAAGHAAATAARIAENEMMFRFAILADIATGVLMVFVVLTMYRLLSQVSSRAYLLLGALLVTALYFTNAIADFAALLFARGEGALSALPVAERDGLMWFFLRIHFQTKEIGRLLWGLLWLIPLGVLAYRSRMLPRVLGALLVVDGAACVVNSTAWFVLPAAVANRLFFSIWPVFLPEVILMFWLLIRGVRLPARAS